MAPYCQEIRSKTLRGIPRPHLPPLSSANSVLWSAWSDPLSCSHAFHHASPDSWNILPQTVFSVLQGYTQMLSPPSSLSRFPTAGQAFPSLIFDSALAVPLFWILPIILLGPHITSLPERAP